MKCDICGSSDAIIHIRQEKEREETVLFLCEECALKKGIALKNDRSEASLTDLLSGLVEPRPMRRKIEKSCPLCGMSYKRFRRKPRAGCHECFSVFSKEIRKVVNQRYGEVRHKGKYPKRLLAFKSYLVDIEQLKRKLETAVREEQYERAAQLRDRIREIQENPRNADAR